MKATLQLSVELEEVWVEIANPKMSMSEAVAKLKDLGNNILKLDEKNRRIKIAQGKQNG